MERLSLDVAEKLHPERSFKTNKELLQHLQSTGKLKSQEVAEVMEKIDGALFVKEGKNPYFDGLSGIGCCETIPSPGRHAICLELLKEHLKPGMRALDVGSGSGYLTACFAAMVGEQGRVVGVELIPQLAEISKQNINKSASAPSLKEGFLSIHVGDGREGWAEMGPYGAIHVGAAAPEIPSALIQQLKRGGRMVIPVGKGKEGLIDQKLKVVDKDMDGKTTEHDECNVVYTPLMSPEHLNIKGW